MSWPEQAGVFSEKTETRYEPETLTYTFPQLCDALQVSERVVRQWMRRREHPLPALRSDSNGRVVCSKDAVRQWLVDASRPVDDVQRSAHRMSLDLVPRAAREKSKP